MDSDKSILVTLNYDGTLDESKGAYVQFAALYTTRTGERRVRVLTLQLAVSSKLDIVFKHADLETTLNIMTKKGALLSK
jgi:protein transport protein SEC24